jgi:hypothetical protein
MRAEICMGGNLPQMQIFFCKRALGAGVVSAQGGDVHIYPESTSSTRGVERSGTAARLFRVAAL